MNVFGIGLPEMALIMVLALLVFGPKKLPEVGRSLGKAIRGFQEASKEFESEFKQEAEQLDQSPSKPLEATLETTAPQVLSPGATSIPQPEVDDNATTVAGGINANDRVSDVTHNPIS